MKRFVFGLFKYLISASTSNGIVDGTSSEICSWQHQINCNALLVFYLYLFLFS